MMQQCSERSSRLETGRSYEERPLVWSEIPASRFSRANAIYHAQPDKDWERKIFSNRRGNWHARGAQRMRMNARKNPFSDEHSQVRFTKFLITIAAALVLIAAFCTLSQGSGSNASTHEDGTPQSTARSQWTKGSMPYLYQTDSEWAGASYAGATVSDSGCGPTCLSMVYVCLTGKKDKDPAQMAAFSQANGYVEGGMTTWAFMGEGARKLGLSSQELSADEALIREQLEKGHPIIASVSKGDFTTQGHFIVLAGIDGFGRILVHDPNSPERSAQAWDLSRILAQTRNLWAFSA